MDAIKIYDATRHALDRIRRGGGPQFLECETYRYRGHSMADPGTYRPAVELKAYQAHDPLSATIRELEFRYPSPDELAAAGPDNVGRLAEHMVNAGHLREVEVERIKQDVQKIVEDAVQFALKSPQPSMEAAWQAMLCNRHEEALI
jgi:pyruvate dehydrogenase E1 component alpha subunit